jgi:hypothetical protein
MHFERGRALKKLLPLSFLAACLSGCGSNNQFVKNGELERTIVQQQDQKRYIETMGIGAADSSLNNSTQRRATSRDAAIVQAQYEMLSIIRGIELEGGITVQKAMETDSKIESYVKDTIKGAEVVRNEWTKDDGCVVTLRLDKKRLETNTGLKAKS